MFIKDKGDEFFKNNDFYSAINAYSQAYKANNELVQCLSNRSVCYLHLFNYKECLDDIETLIEIHTK